MDISKSLTFLRKAHGLTQEELAQKVGVSNRTVSTWERGEKTPRDDTLLKLASVLETTPAYLLGLNEPTDDCMYKALREYLLETGVCVTNAESVANVYLGDLVGLPDVQMAWNVRWDSGSIELDDDELKRRAILVEVFTRAIFTNEIPFNESFDYLADIARSVALLPVEDIRALSKIVKGLLP